MNRKRWLVVAAIAALLAFLLYWTVGRGTGNGDRSARAGEHPSASRGAGGALGDGRAARKVDRVDPRAGATASVGGQVRDEAGAGIGGATVCANAWWGTDLSQDDTRDPRCTTTTADGAWRLRDLWSGRWSLSASAPTFKPLDWRDEPTRTPGVRLAPGEDRAGVDFVLEGGGVQALGTVLDLTGGVVAGAQVTVSSGNWRGGGAACYTHSGDDGGFACWVAPGQVWASAEAEGYAAGWGGGMAPGQHLEVLVTPESVLGGIVVEAGTGTPIAGAKVQLDGDWGAQGQTYSDDAGRFRFTRLAPGRYKPMATAPGLYGEAAESVLLGLAQSRDDLVVEVHTGADVTATVSIAGADGKPEGPASDCRVNLYRAVDNRDYSDGVELDGTVRFDAVQPGIYKVTINCDRLASRGPYPDLEVAATPVTAAWLVERGAVLAGIVVDTDGKPVRQASVWGRNVGGDPRADRGGGGDTTDREGRFVLEGLRPGAVELQAYADGFPEAKEPTKVDLPTVTELRLVLAAGGTIEGTVVDEQGAVLHRVNVAARGERWGGGTSVRDDGTFTMTGMNAGSYRITVDRDGEQLKRPGSTDDDLQGERVTVDAGKTTKVRLVVESSSGTITGRVVDATGLPVTDAFVRAERESEAAGRQRGGALRGARWSWSARPAITDLEGKFTVVDLAPGTYTVLAYRKGGSEAKAEGVALGADVTMTITPTASLAGTIDTGATIPREVQLSLEDPDTGVSRTESFFMTSGAWTIRDLPAGKYDLTATAVEGTATVEDLELADGQHRGGVTLALTPTVTITGRVVDAETGAPVAAMTVMTSSVQGAGRYSWRGGSGGDNVSDASGRFTVKDVSSGRIRISARPRDGGSDYSRGIRIADVQGQGTIEIGDLGVYKRRLPRNTRAGDLGYTLAENPPDADPAAVIYKVAAIRADGPAAGTGLKVGDVIVSADGRDVRGEMSWQYSTTLQVPEGTVVKLGLERGETVSIRAGRPE